MVKTTVDLPDELFIEAKKRAAELRRPLRTLIVEGLRLQLAATRSKQRKPRKLNIVTVPGGLPPGLDLSSREKMHEWLNEQS